MLSLYNKLLKIKTFPQDFLNILLKKVFQILGHSQPLLQTSLPLLYFWESGFNQIQSSLTALGYFIRKQQHFSYSI